ncbi:rCG37810 [Rattus norvegicus]|uniref:RCG37810 n=1 Tax=Rattus norvegicus TaxID=10116 RepID=A6K666_RAT|nr:rCG37810 [Rattus norvegicus]
MGNSHTIGQEAVTAALKPSLGKGTDIYQSPGCLYPLYSLSPETLLPGSSEP